LAEHELSVLPGFVADHRPFKLVWSAEFSSREEALAMERRIKGWTRAKKMALIRGDWEGVARLAKSKDSPSTGSGRTGGGEVLSLWPHPDTPCCARIQLVARVERKMGLVSVHYHITGEVGRLLFAAPVDPCRADGLWQTTCLELFLRDANEPAAYREHNFAPSLAWAAYDFTGYREGMRGANMPAPAISIEQGPDRFDLIAHIALPSQAPLHIGLSAVIEEKDGTKSYWALAHPPGKPDFHHPACFALELPAPSAS